MEGVAQGNEVTAVQSTLEKEVFAPERLHYRFLL